jgi:Autotransporter beta-domain
MLKIPFRKTVNTLLGMALLQFGGSALAFTLITIPQEQTAPSNTITDSTTLTTRIQPITGAIKAQMFGARRLKTSAKTAQVGSVLAANRYTNSASDFDYLTLALNDPAGAEGGKTIGGGDASSLWVSSDFSSLKNDFARTRFNGDIHTLLAGLDYTRSDKYIFGVAISHETSNFNTRFNIGNEKTSGWNISPYFAVLLTEAWSFDLSLGHGKFDTSQSRSVVDITTIPPSVSIVDSDFSSRRNFVSANLTDV